MKKIFTNIFLSLSIFVFCLPIYVFAQGGGSGNTDTNTGGGIVYECTGDRPGDCTFNDVLEAIKKVVNWATIFAIQFSVIVIAYAGFKYMISGDQPGERAAANTMLLKVVKGMIFILLAWVIVRLIISGLQVDGRINTFLN